MHLELSNGHVEQIAGVSWNISDFRCVILITDLNPGKYSFKYFHDLNCNKELDTNWLGIPKEALGISNNLGITFGPPSLEKTLFELEEIMQLTCKPKYF